MATTKRRTSTTSERKTAPRKQDQGLAARTGRTIKQQPYVSAAIATGAVTAVAAAVAGAFFFRRNEKTIGEITEDVSDKIKDGYAEARSQVVKGARAVKEKAAFLWDDEPTQVEIMEEALTLKDTGRRTKRPVDDTIDTELKAGSIAY
jgi:hypothetical protein